MVVVIRHPDCQPDVVGLGSPRGTLVLDRGHHDVLRRPLTVQLLPYRHDTAGRVEFELGQRGQVLGSMPGVEKLLTPLVTAMPVSVSHLKPDDLIPKANILRDLNCQGLDSG